MFQDNDQLKHGVTQRLKQQIQVLRSQYSFLSLEQEAARQPCLKSFQQLWHEHTSPGLVPELVLDTPALKIQERILSELPTAKKALLMLNLLHFSNLNDAVDEMAWLRHQYLDSCFILRGLLVDEYQILQARALGMNALTLIPDLLGSRRLQTYVDKTRLWGLEPILEIYHPDELKLALQFSVQTVFLSSHSENHSLWQAEDLSLVQQLFPQVLVHVLDRRLLQLAFEQGLKTFVLSEALWQERERLEQAFQTL